MKKLYLLRHAKSDWDADFGDDHERPLNRRGTTAAARVGRALGRLGPVPQAILTSTAVRARSTAERAREAGDWDCPLATSRALYLTSPQHVIEEIQRQDEDIARLMVVGHQPVWSRLLALLACGEDGPCAVRFPTAALARLDLDVERWKDVAPGRGELRFLVTPKLLQRLGID